MQRCNWCGQPYEGRGLRHGANPFGGYCSNQCEAQARGRRGVGGGGVSDGLSQLMIGFFVAAVFLFFAPALLVIWPFSFDLAGAITTTLTSVWAWLGSLAFWVVVGFFGYHIWKNMPPQQVSQTPVAPGRIFSCYNCHQQAQESFFGALERSRGGVVCPHCKATNVLNA
jgi:hypothetical protein